MTEKVDTFSDFLNQQSVRHAVIGYNDSEIGVCEMCARACDSVRRLKLKITLLSVF